MVDVTRVSFEKEYLRFETLLRECDFFSIDTELTGLRKKSSERVHLMDNSQEYYDKIKSAVKFGLSQYGICLWKWDKVNEKWISMPFNFHVFPSINYKLDQCFLSQSSSLGFLASNNFDFNKWIREGIPFVSHKVADPLVKDGIIRLREKSNDDQPILNDSDKAWLSDTMKLIEEWLAQNCTNSFNLPPCNAFHRRILYSEIDKRFDNLSVQSDQAPCGDRCLVVSRCTPEQKQILETQRKQKALDEFNQEVGFRRIIDLISASRKPLVGHNLFLDLLHSFEKFFEELPAEWSSCKEKIHTIFPIVFDTKYIAQAASPFAEKFQRTNLDYLYKLMQNESSPEIEFAEGFSLYNNKAIFHEAGFDAYATGVIFLKMAHQLMKASESSQIDLLPNREFYSPFVNRLNLMYSNLIYRLDGPDVIPDRSNIFYVYGFPISTNTGDLFRYFSRFGSVRIRWLSETEAFVIYDSKLDRQALISESGQFHFQDFDEFQSRNVISNGHGKRSRTSTTSESNERPLKIQKNNSNGNCVLI